MSKRPSKPLLKTCLADGLPQLGTFIKIFSPEIIEMIGMAGFDFIVIDMEHTTLQFNQVEQMTRAADLYGLNTIIRIPDNQRSTVLRALDLDSAGIQVPQVYGADEVRDLVDKAKYPPEGSRGLTFSTRAASYGYALRSYTEDSNRDGTVIVHIETREAYEKIDDICKIPGLDVVFIGPLDLSTTLGVNSDYMAGDLVEPVQHILHVCRENKKSVGIAVTSEEQYAFALEHKIPYIAWSSDVAIIKQGIERIAKVKRET